MKWKIGALTLFVFFLLFHYADRFLVTAVATRVMEEFHVDTEQLGLVFTVTLLLSALLYPIWGYLFDCYSRRLLVSVTATIWGFTSLINAFSRNFREFFATRISTAVDDAAPPGMMSLVIDYFEPHRRARALGFVKITAPLGAILGTVLALSIVAAGLSWRYAFYITGSIGIVTGVLCYLIVRDVPRGSSEPELMEVLTVDIFKARVSDLVKILRNKSLLLLYLYGFFGQFPWAVIAYWILTYMELERGMDPMARMATMVIWLIAMSIGNMVAGFLGDFAYRKSIRGRAIYGAVVVLMAALMLYAAIKAETDWSFLLYGTLTAFIFPQTGPLVSAMWGDVTEPELRSSAASYQSFFETIGSSFGPWLAGALAKIYGLGGAILLISVWTWVLSFAFFVLLAIRIPRDARALRELLRARADMIKGGSSSDRG